ncbi:hypothetical protein MATL_G00163620 [Megalops atlanticus]|uniref:1-phosphatidylinositol 4,5-bisphosphate phosphodiesterase n=1 Tax=Megalops atlanticus TaxID=7932 RepID=A0A9D3PT71_MEGAT|nr:hypothetical protein MATL_G00163620 [Megalops atlanticus]
MKMDPKGYYLYWTYQNREIEFLDVATIRDTRSGKYAKMPKNPKVRNVFNMDFPDSHHLAKTLTIVSGPDMVNLTYHNFFAYKEKVTQNWASDILAIAYNTQRNNACRQVFLDKVYVRISLQTNKDGKIPVKNIYKMFPADKKRVESALASAHLPKGKGDTMKPEVFTEAAFKAFLMSLCPRPEIYEIFTSYSAKAKPYMTKENLAKFLNEKQRDSRLNEELFPPMRPDQVKALIEKYEPCSSNANRGQISPEGLLFYLMGPETSVVILNKLVTCQDMTQPLPHYFIKSSHNTYLTAGQFSGVSSPEMYRQCLLAGCRCLELDCWKGKPPEEEPVITHGFTMTTEILFKDVIEAIAESAFKTSQYPIILSFENHVDSVKQQEKMANYCKTIFGDALLVDPLEKYPLKPGHQIPSPAELMGKILIKNKKNNPGKQDQEPTKKAAVPDQNQNQADANQNQNHNSSVSQEGCEGELHDDHEEHEEHDDQDEEKMKNSDEGTAGQEVTAYEEMSALVNYIQPNKFISFENAKKKNKSYVISSFVETKGGDLISKTAVEFVEYNKRQMSRIYPKGTRMDSSNYNPQTFWNAGCQMVALNYQTMDFPMQLNMALFEFNGRTGYLLKHDLLRRSDKKFDPYTDRIDTIVASTLTVKVYSGQFLSDKNVKTGVEVEVIGLPGDPKRKYRTKWSATANAINPVWNEEPFVFEKILLPEMASLRMVVHEESGKFLGHRILPIYAIQSGFHHVCLRSESNMPLTLPALFVYIEVKDYIPAAFADFTDALFNPTKGSEKSTKSQEEYLCPFEMPIANLPRTVEEQTVPSVVQTEPAADATSCPNENAVTDPSAAAVSEECPLSVATADTTPDPEPQPISAADLPPAADNTAPAPNSETSAANDSTQSGPPSPSETALVSAGPDPNAKLPPDSDSITDVASVSDADSTTDTPPRQEVNSTIDVSPAPDAAPCQDDDPLPDDTNDVDTDSTPTSDPCQAVELPLPPVARSPDIDPSSEPAVSPKPEKVPADPVPEPTSVTLEELKLNKSFLKVTKKQEKEIRELEKKFQRKGEDLIQKYSELFRSLKKKTSVKKKESRGEKVDPGLDKAVELKATLQAELKVLREEQFELLKRRREQHATEQLAKLLELATERHASEAQALQGALESETKESKKKEGKRNEKLTSSVKSDKGRLKKEMSSDPPDDVEQTTKALSEGNTMQQEALRKKQAAILEQIKDETNQLNRAALSEHAEKMRSLPAGLRDAVNTCVSPHFPDLVDQPSMSKVESSVYGDVFLG